MPASTSRPQSSLDDKVEEYVKHLESIRDVFNAHAAERNLSVRLNCDSAVDAVYSGILLDRVASYFDREDDSGVLHAEQLKTAINCISEMLDKPNENGVILGAMQSGKTTTSLALQFAGPVIYMLTGRRPYPVYLMTSHTSQEDQTSIELQNFLNYYGNIKIELSAATGAASLEPGFLRSPTIAYYRTHVLRDALGDVHMGPRLEDFIHRRVHGQRLREIADLCQRAHSQGFESLLIIDEPQYGASDRIVVDEDGQEQRRSCVLLQIFEAIEEALGGETGSHSFVGLSATPYETHELQSVWVVRQYLGTRYRGFNYFGKKVIAEGVEIDPPETLGFTELATRFEAPMFAKISMGAYAANAAKFATFAKRHGLKGSVKKYQREVRDAVRAAILKMVAEADGEPIGICIRPFNNNARSADFVRLLDLESAGIEVIAYYGAEYSGQSVKRAIRARQHPDRPFVVVVTNRARMGDAFPTSVKWFVDFAARASDLNALLQGLLGRACGYNKMSTVVLSDDNAALVADYRRTMGGYFYKTSRHSIVVNGYRRGAPTNLIRVRADLDDEFVKAFFQKIEEQIVPNHVIQDRATLQTTRNRTQGFRTGPLLKIASSLNLFDHLEQADVAEKLFPSFPPGFKIVRANQKARHSRDGRMLGYMLIKGDCRFTFRWTDGDGAHAGVSSRGYGARDATDRARAADGLEPQIHMEKYDPATGAKIYDKGEDSPVSGNWRAYMVTFPLLEPVRELEEGTASYPNARSVYRRLMNDEEEELADYDE